jgi:hypothetical protein
MNQIFVMKGEKIMGEIGWTVTLSLTLGVFSVSLAFVPKVLAMLLPLHL